MDNDVSYKVGQLVMYEGHKCRIIALDGTSAKLVNLFPKDDSDWKSVEVLLINIKEN